MNDFLLKRGDTSPAILGSLVGGDGSAVSITGASVRFHMARDANGEVVVDAAAAVVDAAAGQVRYDWQPADTMTAGRFRAEFEVTYSDGTVETFPNDGDLQILIRDDLA